MKINEILQNLMEEKTQSTSEKSDTFSAVQELDEEDKLFRDSLDGSRALLGDITTKVNNQVPVQT